MSEETKVHAEDEKQPEETVNDEVETTEEETTEEESTKVETPKQEEPQEQVKRPAFMMSVAKAQKEKERAIEKMREELEAKHAQELETLKSQASINESSDDEALKLFAEEQGVDVEALKKIVGFAQKPLIEKMSKLDELTAEKEKEAHYAQVSQDFDTRVSSLIQKDFPNATPEHISSVKKSIIELAFTPEFNTYRLEDIYKVNKDQYEYKDNYGVEPSDGNTVDIIDFSSMTDEQEHKLAQENPEKFAEYIKWQEAKHSVYRDL